MMIKLILVLIATGLLAATLCSSAFAQDYQPAPEGLHTFLGQLRDLSAARDTYDLEKCILPYVGMRAYGNSITRMDLADARNMDYMREFEFKSEGIVEVQLLKLTDFLFGEFRCFGLLGNQPFTKGILLTESQRWDDDMPAYYEKAGCDYLAYPLEEYENGDTVYGVDFSPYESQHAIVGIIGERWYLLAIYSYE
jgi:hypothetical protein